MLQGEPEVKCHKSGFCIHCVSREKLGVLACASIRRPRASVVSGGLELVGVL